jgi:hypothetical protein
MIFAHESEKDTIKRMIQVNEDRTKFNKYSAQAQKVLIGSLFSITHDNNGLALLVVLH